MAPDCPRPSRAERWKLLGISVLVWWSASCFVLVFTTRSTFWPLAWATFAYAIYACLLLTVHTRGGSPKRLWFFFPLTVYFVVGAALLRTWPFAGGLLAAIVLACLLISTRSPWRWLTFAVVLAITSLTIAVTFYQRPMPADAAQEAGIGAVLADVLPLANDAHTTITLDITVFSCADPVAVRISSAFPKTYLARSSPRLGLQLGDRLIRSRFAIPDLRWAATSETSGRIGIMDGRQAAPATVAVYADWLRWRGVGSCYLRVPELQGARAENAYRALGVSSEQRPDVWADVEIHSALEVSRGPLEDVADSGLTNRRCRATDRSCTFDFIITSPWRDNFVNVMLLVIGALFSVMAELALGVLRSS